MFSGFELNVDILCISYICSSLSKYCLTLFMLKNRLYQMTKSSRHILNIQNRGLHKYHCCI